MLHEVRPVETGARVILTYNLIYNGQDQLPNPTKLEEEKIELRAALKEWRDQVTGDAFSDKCLVYPFEHEYSEANLTVGNLKRKDRARAVAASQIAEELGLCCFLALISKTVVREEYEDSDTEEDVDVECKVLDFRGQIVMERVSLPPIVLATDQPWSKGYYEEEEGEYTGNYATESTYW